MSGSSSVLSSLEAALHGLPYPMIFHGRSSGSTIHPTLHGHPLMDAFDSRLCEELRGLQARGQYLSAEWVGQALEAVLSVHSKVQEMFPHFQQAELRHNSKWISDHLEDTVKLLDVCIALRETMGDIRQYTGTMQVAVQRLSRVSFGPGQLQRARTAMDGFKGFPKPKEAWKFRLENCGSILWRLGEKLAPPPLGAARRLGFLEAIHASKAFTVFVCGVMVAALSIKSRRSVAAPCAGSSVWGCALQRLCHKVRNEMDKRRSKGGGRPLLQELEAVEAAARRLCEFVNRLIKTKSVPLNDSQGQELRQSVQCLKGCVVELEQAMAPFERHINELFRVLITSRMSLLNILSHS